VAVGRDGPPRHGEGALGQVLLQPNARGLLVAADRTGVTDIDSLAVGSEHADRSVRQRHRLGEPDRHVFRKHLDDRTVARRRISHLGVRGSGAGRAEQQGQHDADEDESRTRAASSPGSAHRHGRAFCTVARPGPRPVHGFPMAVAASVDGTLTEHIPCLSGTVRCTRTCSSPARYDLIRRRPHMRETTGCRNSALRFVRNGRRDTHDSLRNPAAALTRDRIRTRRSGLAAETPHALAILLTRPPLKVDPDHTRRPGSHRSPRSTRRAR
jgi:hypothetical protein